MFNLLTSKAMEELNNSLYIRRFKESDTSTFIQNLEIEKVYEHMRKEFPKTPSEAKDFIAKTSNYAVEFNGNFAGSISLFREENDIDCYEIGCMWIFKQFTKLGIATQVTIELARKVFNECNLSKVYIRTYKENEEPQHIVSKIGFVRDSDHDIWYENKKLYYYEITREQFEEKWSSH